jgi:hypothetical protein
MVFKVLWLQVFRNTKLSSADDMSTTLNMFFDLMTVYRKPGGKRPIARTRSGWEIALNGS